MSVRSYIVVLSIFIFFLRFQLTSTNATTIAQIFEQWMKNHGRTYPNSQEKMKRFTIFQENLEYVNRFNNLRGKTYTIGLNQFSDMTTNEVLGRVTSNQAMLASETSSMFSNKSNDQVPDRMDWREAGAVSSVKKQGGCGESHHFTLFY